MRIIRREYIMDRITNLTRISSHDNCRNAEHSMATSNKGCLPFTNLVGTFYEYLNQFQIEFLEKIIKMQTIIRAVTLVVMSRGILKK